MVLEQVGEVLVEVEEEELGSNPGTGYGSRNHIDSSIARVGADSDSDIDTDTGDNDACGCWSFL